jgi:hypothetical protein
VKDRLLAQSTIQLLLVILLVTTGAFLFRFAERQPNINDTIGYVYAGQRLAAGEGMSLYDAHNQWQQPFFTMYAFRIQQPGDERLYLVYPPGLPLLLASAILLTGWSDVVHYVVPLLALAGIGGAFVLGWLATGSSWGGWWAAVLLATTSAFWTFSTASWSEAPSMTLLTWGAVCFLLAYNKNWGHGRQIAVAALGGLLTGVTFFIRYTNVVVLLAFLLAQLLYDDWRFWRPGSRHAFFVTAGLIFLTIPLFNYVYYGGPTLTGYSPEHGWYPWSAFSITYFWGASPVGGYSGREIGVALWQNFSWLLLLLPLGLWRLRRPSLIIIAGVVGFTFIVYAVYAFAPVGINSRFLLPIFPFILAAVSAGLLYLGEKLPSVGWRWIVGLGFLALTIWPLPGQFVELQRRNDNNQNAVNHIQALVADTDPTAVFLSYTLNDHIYFYGNRSVLNYRYIPPVDAVEQRYKIEFVEPCLVTAVGDLLDQGITVYYLNDSSPSFWNSLSILQTYFEMEPDPPESSRYRITTPLTDREGDNLICPPRHP